MAKRTKPKPKHKTSPPALTAGRRPGRSAGRASQRASSFRVGGGLDGRARLPSKTQARSRGRPTKYSSKLADAIFERLADGEPISRICRRPGMPCQRTVMRWQDERPDFCHLITSGRKFGCDALIDQVLEGVDRCPNDNDAIRACRLK